MSEYDSMNGMWGDGMPKGNKSAGYVGLMIAKAQGKTRNDYDPKQRKKKIGKLDINRVNNPSDYLKHAYIDKYKALHVGSPRKTWEQVKAEASDIKHAVATWARLHPNKDERTIARETGVSQPSVNRWKRLTGQGKEDMLDERQKAIRENFMAEKPQPILNTQLAVLRGDTLQEGAKARSEIKGIKGQPRLTSLMRALKSWEDERDTYYGLVSSQNVARIKRIMALQGEDSDNEDATNELRGTVDDPTPVGTKAPLIRNLPKLAQEQYYLRVVKDAYFKANMVIKQIKRAIIKTVLSIRSEDPQAEPLPLRKENLNPQAEDYNPDDYKEGENYIEDENANEGDAGNPSGAGRRGGRGTNFFDDMRELYDKGKDVATAFKGVMDALPKKKKTGGAMPNRINQFASEYERRPVRGGAVANYINNYAQEYQRRPVRGGGKTKNLYTKDGKVYNGLYHTMPDGSIHSGKKHGVRSKELVLK